MTIVEKVINLLDANGDMTLGQIYEHLPEHTKASIRGNINRYLKRPEAKIRRIDKGVYSVIEIVKVDKMDDGTSSINYTATYYSEDKLIQYIHEDFQITEAVEAGVYQRMDDFESFEDLENHMTSLRGVFCRADAREVMAKLKSESFDLLVTDPPYKTISGGNKAKGAPKGMLSKNDGRIFKHNDIKFSEWLPEAYRLLKPGAQAYIFTNLLNLKEVWEEAEKAGFKVHNLLVWEKNNATPNRWYMKNHEYVLYLYKKGMGQPVSIKDCGCKTVHQFDNIVGDKLHETEKPVDLLRMYIRNSCPVNGWVLDPFAGSASTLISSLLEKVRCFTIEIDEKYTDADMSRIKDYLVSGKDLAHA